MVWNVVNFLSEDLVEAVPACWYVKDSMECFWPPSTTQRQKILKMIKTKEIPDDNWKPHKVQLLGTYEDFKVAQRKANKAKILSDISSANDIHDKPHYKKRKRIPNPKYKSQSSSDDSVSEVDDSSEDSVFPVLNTSRSAVQSPHPKVQKSNREESEPKRQKMNSPHPVSLDSEPERPIMNSSVNQLVNIGQSIVDFNKSDTPTDDVFKKLVVKELSNLNLKVNTLVDSVNTLINVKNLQQANQNMQACQISDNQIRFLNDNLPLENLEKLNKFEQWLTELPNYNYAVTEFRRVGGNSMAQAIRRLLYRSLKNELAAKYSWDGHKQKFPLKHLKIAQCILDTIKMQYVSVSENEIINIIKVWLVKAKERFKRENLPLEEVFNH